MSRLIVTLRGDNIVQAINNKIKALGSPEAKTNINRIYADMCDPYVPYDTGALSKNVQVSENGVTYSQPYARRQYHGENIAHNLTHHPLATAKWNEAMLADHGDEFIQAVTEELRKDLKKG